MKNEKLERLFNSARNEPAPQAGSGFEARVMRAIRHEGPAKPVSLIDQLNALFPRLAFAAATVIVLCATADWVLSNVEGSDLASGVSVISEDWLFPTKGF
jgi:hypothetical protein